jgi:hypothetical protein
MAVLKTGPSPLGPKPESPIHNALAFVMRDFEALMCAHETVLLRSLAAEADGQSRRRRREHIRREAGRLALSDLGTVYTRKQIARSLHAVESLGKSAEERLRAATHHVDLETEPSLAMIRNGHFRLYSTDLFEALGRPIDIRFGTLRFHTYPAHPLDAEGSPATLTAVELALNTSFFVARSDETHHSFSIPEIPSLTNRGILSRKPDDEGAFPDYDSWLLFTFLGNGCLKVEIPIEMCADVYGGDLRGRENEEVVFWAMFVEDAPAG